jgi:hypothetical protein
MSLPCGGSHRKWRPRTTPRGPRLVDLDEAGRQPERLERVELEDLQEPAAVVGKDARPDEADVGDGGGFDGERHGYITTDRYIITRPPSTARTWPVMNAASSDARNATALATSSVVPNRPSGVWALIWCWSA